MSKITEAQNEALRWLANHNGEGTFQRGGHGNTLIAAGEVAPVMRSTWNALRILDLVEFFGGPKGQSRCRLTDAGKARTA